MMRIVYICLLAFLTGCAGVDFTPEFQHRVINTNDFKLAAWVRDNGAGPITIYVEGDGHSFDSAGRPTLNPTPRGAFVRNMAIESADKNVAYLARPCQFVDDEKCEQKYWTTHRFSQSVIDSTAYAIREIAKMRPVTLVGFSGGAMVAGLTAVLNTDIDVVKIITYSGNLDHEKWTTYHNLPPLSGSLNLVNYRDEFIKIPSVHYVGDKDTVIPPQLVVEFISDDHPVIIVPAKGHGW